jgi:hypothetical protein
LAVEFLVSWGSPCTGPFKIVCVCVFF